MLHRYGESDAETLTTPLSPLRYPGGKRRLAGYVADLLRLNGLRPELFVEPFAGGASVALQLLTDNLVEQIALGEVDSLISSFWRVVFADPEWLIEQMNDIPVTLETWDYFRSAELKSVQERALACLFLNRTSFSGILALTAGPIGGRSQSSSYTIECRFPKDKIARRIRQISKLQDRVSFIEHGDWSTTVKRAHASVDHEHEVMFYFDPPFFHKASRLYRHSFTLTDHEQLRDHLVALKAPWLLSYDPAQTIIDLYASNGHKPSHVEILYSARASDSLQEAKELIITNLPATPTRTRLWSSGNGTRHEVQGSYGEEQGDGAKNSNSYVQSRR